MNLLASIWHGIEFVATQLVAVVGINLSIEQPSFEILHQLNDSVEIRQYPARIIAETTVELNGSDGTLTPEEASSQAFRRIAGYIFGANLS
ncbi:MAG: heme-binding protein, partial [Alphaproteobacteria bacterium]|nr:heme-binding protein [Alphaproteobacteria bacterium]